MKRFDYYVGIDVSIDIYALRAMTAQKKANIVRLSVIQSFTIHNCSTRSLSHLPDYRLPPASFGKLRLRR